MLRFLWVRCLSRVYCKVLEMINSSKDLLATRRQKTVDTFDSLMSDI